VEAEQQLLILQQEKKLKQSEMENLHLEMKLKEHELVQRSLQNASLNQTSRNMLDKLIAFQYRMPRKKDQDEFRQVISEIGFSVKSDGTGDFDSLFRQMHHEFYDKLLEVCPQLSKSELQVCALLRLNLSSKDIAQIISLNPASIDVTRSRIRKKLGLETNVNLTNYLIRLT
jgi:DNA-binding CsgD family transcriptional regulator